MRTLLLFCLLCFIRLSTFGQIVLLDNDDDTPVSFAHVISESGNLIATSDLNGLIKLDSISNLKNHYFIIQHISYENNEITGKELNAKDTVFLSKKTYTLPDVVVGTVKPEVIVIKGYYRSYELDDNVPKFYTDGIVEYYIPLANEKKIKMRLIEYRSYGNISLIEKEKQRTNTIVMRLAGIPRIEHNSIIQSLGKHYKTRNSSKNELEIIKDTSIVGTIKRNLKDHTIQSNMDLIAPKQSETKTLFNYTSQIINNELIEVYPDMEFSEISVKDILRRKKHKKILFKHKKDNDFVKLEGVDELYIFDKYYISKENFKKIKSSSYAFPESSSFSNVYWKTLSQYNIPSPNKNIENLFGKILTEYK